MRSNATVGASAVCTTGTRSGLSRFRTLALALMILAVLPLCGGDGERALASPLASAIVSWEWDQVHPAAAYSPTAGTYLVVWEDHHWGCGDNWDIYGRLAASDGTPQGGTFGISWDTWAGYDNHRLAPDVAYNSSANAYLVVLEYAYSDTDHDILARFVNADGTLPGSDFGIHTTGAYQSRPAVAYDPVANSYLVVYEERVGSDEFAHMDIRGVVVSAAGVVGDPFAIATTSLDNLAPDVAYAQANNQYLVVWQDERLAPAGFDILGQRVTGAGVLTGGQILVGCWDGEQLLPRVAYAPDADEFLVVWEDHHWGEAAGWDIYGQRVTAGGALTGGAIIVADPGTLHMTAPDIAYNAVTRNYLVVFEYAFSPTDLDVYGRRIAYDGTHPDPIAVVSGLGSYEGSPAVASNAGTGLLVVWEDGRNAATMGLDLYGEGRTITLPALSGLVYEGSQGNTSTPLPGVTVQLYCSSGSGTLGTLVTTKVTNRAGAYNLPVPGQCEVYNILETDLEGYTSVGAATVSGHVVNSNWIEYVHPLSGKTLSGNLFWDVVEGPDDTLPPGNWTAFSPAGWTNVRAVPVSIRVEDGQSGLAVGTAAVSYSEDNGDVWTAWEPAACTGSDGTSDPQTISAVVTFGQDGGGGGPNRVRFRIDDMAGNPGMSGEYLVYLDTVPPANPTSLTSASHAAYVWSHDLTSDTAWSGATDDRSGIAGYAYGWDHVATTVPDGWDTAGTTVVDYPLSESGGWYFHVRAYDNAGNAATGAVHFGPVRIDITPPWSQASSPATTGSTTFQVTWTGGDNVSGIDSYDVHVRDVTTAGIWMPFFTDVALTSAPYTGQNGHVYEFRSRARDKAGNLESWPASYDSRTAVTTVDFEAFALEINQSVQDLDNSVLLVTSKRTFARFHVRSLLNASPGPVTARLQAWRGGTYLGAIVPNNPGAAMTVRQTPNRSLLGDTFYFDLPASWLWGTVTFTAQIDPAGAWAETNTANNIATTAPLTFQAAPEMTIGMIDICYTLGSTTYHITDQERWELEDFLLAAYPIHTLNVWWGTLANCYTGVLNAAGNLASPSSNQVNAMLSWNQSQAILHDSEYRYTRYYGMADTAGSFMRGASVKVPGTVACGPTWNGAAWYGGHELGHTCGEYHTRGTTPPPCGTCGVPPCNGDCGCEGGATVHYPNGDISPTRDPTRADALYGLDFTTNPPSVRPPSWKEIMTYCLPEWVSDYTYTALYNRLLWEASTATASVQSAAASEHLAVFSSIITPTDQVSLGAFYRVPDSWDVFERVPGAYSIRLLGSGGATLADYPFTPRYTHLDPGPTCGTGAEEQPAALITEYVPWVVGTTRVAIYHGTQELASRSVSAHAPQIALTYPNAGALTGDAVTVSWAASDVDGGTREATLEFSTDGGATWAPVGSGITTTQVTLALAHLPGTTQGKFRVIVTDGVNTVTDASDGLLTVENKAPEVRITSPEALAVFVEGQSVALEGRAMDVEDGSLSGAALVWTSDIVGPLGTGGLLHRTDLPVGVHTITLTATDDGGTTGSASVTISVGVQGTGARVYLPLVVRH